jgi:hypothetical protein
MDIFGLPRTKDVAMGWSSAFNSNELKLKQRLIRSDGIYGNAHLQKGDGLFSSVGQALGRAVTAVRNAAPSSDPNARPLYPGENHAVLSVNGRPANANYMGPGTHVVQRIIRGDPPRSESDKVAQAHDLRYQLGFDERMADQKMLDKLAVIRQQHTDNDFNVNMGTLPIKSKIAAENRGILKKGKFSSHPDPMTSQEEGVLREKLKSLEQEGYGLGLVGGCKEPMAACPQRPKRKKKVAPLPGEELLSSIQKGTKRQKIQSGRGCGQRGRGVTDGVGSDPYSGPWMSGEWQNAISLKPIRHNQTGNGIGNEPYAGSWMQGEWQNSLSGSGLKTSIKGVSNEPYGGSWLQGEWQSQTGGAQTRSVTALTGRQPVVHSITPPRRQRRQRRQVSVADAPPAPRPASNEASYPSSHHPLSVFGPRREADPIPPEDMDIIDLAAPEAEEVVRRRSRSRSVRRDEVVVPARIAVPARGRKKKKGSDIFELPYLPRLPNDVETETINSQYRQLRKRGEHRPHDYLNLRRALGRTNARYNHDADHRYLKTDIPAGAKRYQSGNRPLLYSRYARPPADEKTPEIDQEKFEKMNAAEKRQVLREQLGPLDEDKEDFSARMIAAKRHKYTSFPWLKQFQQEITRFIIPVLAELVSMDPRGPNNLTIHDIADRFIELTTAYNDDERFGTEGWRFNNPKGLGSYLLRDGSLILPPMGERDTDHKVAVNRVRGRGLKLAGQGLKLAGQGLNKRLSDVCAMKLEDESHRVHHMGRAAAKHISNFLVHHMKGNGCSIPKGLGQNFTDYLTEPMTCRVQAHMCGEEGEAHQSGSGFWHSLVEGFKKVLPYIKMAATVAPMLL